MQYEFDWPANRKMEIDGVLYDVFVSLSSNVFGDETFLYYDGKPAGRLIGSHFEAYAGCDPATLKNQQILEGNFSIGTVSVPVQAVDGPDLERLELEQMVKNAEQEQEAETVYQVYQLTAADIKVVKADGTLLLHGSGQEKTAEQQAAQEKLSDAKAALVAAMRLQSDWKREIVEGASKEYAEAFLEWEKSHSTIAQGFQVPERLRNASGVQYVGAHLTADGGVELGYIDTTAALDDERMWEMFFDGSTFSPFIVYALVPVEEPEVKTLSAAIVEDETASAITHTVVRGENLTDIARMYGCTVDEIVALNSDLIENPSKIYVGWVLMVPAE